MFDIAPQVAAWLAEDRPVTVGRLVGGHGLAGREAAPAAAWTPDRQPVGSAVAARAAGSPAGPVTVALDDGQAAAVGLACGGTARILVQPATDVPAAVWAALSGGEPAALVDRLDGDDVVAGSTTGFTGADVPAAHARIFGRGVTAVTRTGEDLLTTYWPRTRVLVVGAGPVAEALAVQAGLLGWQAQVSADVAGSLAAIAGFGRADAVVVLSHDRDVDGPVLAAAVASGAGYVGAMGSRATQAARRDWFAAHGVTGTGRIHGPAGVAVGGFGPAEIALSICAEIVGVRSGALPATAGELSPSRP